MSKNVDLKVTKNKLVITINLDETYGFSKSGKSTVIASTGGNIPIPERKDIRIGVNCYSIEGRRESHA